MKLHPPLAALLIAAASISSFAETRKPLGPLVVVDAAGRTVGRFGGSFQHLHTDALAKGVYATINGALVAIQMSSCYGPGDGISTTFCWGAGRVFFGSSDCTGPVMIESSIFGAGAPVNEVLRTTPGGPAFLYIASGPMTLKQYNSIQDMNGCYAVSGSAQIFDAAAPIDLSTMFTERFHIE